MALYNELPTSFPWYQRKEHQNRYRLNVAGTADLPAGYKPIDLLCPYDALLPFQFFAPQPTAVALVPTSWGIYRESDDNLVQMVPLAGLNSTYLPGIGRRYFYHDGRQQNFHLSNGAYYSRIDFPNGFKQYSEVFQVCNFSVLDSNCPFLKLQWWNDSDIDPIFYNDKVNGKPRFTNVVYLDTFIHEFEPEIVEETANDANTKPVPTFTLANLRYKIALVVPGYLKIALVLSQMHDHVLLTTAGVEHRSGELERLSTTTETQLGGAFATLEMLFEQNVLVKKASGNNMI